MNRGRKATRATAYLTLVAVLGLVAVVGLTVRSRTHSSPAGSKGGSSTPARPLRVMAVGDSITDGHGVPGSYRRPLARDVLIAGGSMDFVGSVESGPDDFLDRQSEGHPGWRIDEIAAVIANRVETYTPDVVLLLIGTNDVAQDHDVEHAPERLAQLIDTITTTRPGIKVLVGTITRLADPILEARAEAYNAGVAAVVDAASKAGGAVQLVDIHAAVKVSQLFDGMHPDAGGYEVMARTWLAALRPLLGL